MMNFIWQGKENGALIIAVLENVSLKFSEIFQLKSRGDALDLVSVQAGIWNSMTVLNSAKVIFPSISENANDSDFLVALLVFYFRRKT